MNNQSFLIPVACYVTAALKFGKEEITDSVPRTFFRPCLFSSIHRTDTAVEPHQRSDASSVWNFCDRFSDAFRGKTSSDVTKCLAFVASVSVRCRSKTETPVPRSFFVSKPNGNACYAGYEMFGCFLTLAKLLCHSSTVIMSFFHFETYCGIFDLATLQKSLLKQN